MAMWPIKYSKILAEYEAPSTFNAVSAQDNRLINENNSNAKRMKDISSIPNPQSSHLRALGVV